ncbi:hypothetical protein PoB_003575100 [Plakobranchus ocellatus]|uniref:Uncharacterized protein n=1 Tax=Plakobranchus ocellatus TaxID=259542 RepID=A0AAV4AM26_9GAST|nr:hypothetical protein PoB_003575100 [Plakobranchus ocellatus]
MYCWTRELLPPVCAYAKGKPTLEATRFVIVDETECVSQFDRQHNGSTLHAFIYSCLKHSNVSGTRIRPGHLIASPFPLSNRGTGVTQGCNSQRIALTPQTR